MPVHKCPNGKYRIGSGDCVFESKEKAERAYKAYLAKKHDADEDNLGERNTEFLLMFDSNVNIPMLETLVDTIDTMDEEQKKKWIKKAGLKEDIFKDYDNVNSELIKKIIENGMDSKATKEALCYERKKKILKANHPKWSEDKINTAARLACTGDSSIVEQIKKVSGSKSATGGGYYGIGRVANISLRKIASVVKAIKTKGTQKVGHMGMAPFLTSLPQKSLNRLQTKLEQLLTEEQKFLTAEQRQQRSQYAVTMKKRDTDEIIELIGEENMKYLLDNEQAFVYDQLEILNANTGLNNIIKAPIVLAKEIVQEYVFKEPSGSKRTEHHFKPFMELAKSIETLAELPMIIEHKDSWEDDEVIGYVKEFAADEKLRAIRGTGYFYESRLPKILLDALKNGDVVAVSIGFMAELGGSGLWNGLVYDHTQENIILEHLAICLSSVPRCPTEMCGVNLGDNDTIDSEKFTIINKDNYYYNIQELLSDSKETRIESKNIKKSIKSDNMPDDSFTDPKSGNGPVDNYPKDFEVMLGRLKRYINGESDLIKPNFAKQMISEILHMTDDEGEEEITDSEEGEDMEQEEFEDAIAKKDEEIASLKIIVKDSLINEIKEFTTKEEQEKLDLEDACIDKLKIIRDAVTVLKPVKEEPDVLPTESKSEKKKEMEDAGAAPSEKKKYDTSDMFAKTNEEFDDLGIAISG